MSNTQNPSPTADELYSYILTGPHKDETPAHFANSLVLPFLFPSDFPENVRNLVRFKVSHMPVEALIRLFGVDFVFPPNFPSFSVNFPHRRDVRAGHSVPAQHQTKSSNEPVFDDEESDEAAAARGVVARPSSPLNTPDKSIVSLRAQEVSEDEEEYEDGSPSCRNWNFTWNNYPPDYEEVFFTSLGADSIRYVVMGKEIAPTTGTHHVQGFVSFKNSRVRGRNSKKTGKPDPRSLRGLLYGVSWRPVRKTPHLAANYCRKDNDYREFGERPRPQGERTDLCAVAEEVVYGATPSEVAEKFPAEYVKYNKGIQALFFSLHRDRTERPNIIWLAGASGVGKNEIITQKHGRDYYVKSDGTEFWIGYEFQQAVVINEFTTADRDPKKGWVLETLLQLFDKHKFNVHIKGTHAPFSSPFIYITSPWLPSYWYPREPDLNQLLRRLDAVFTVRGTDTCLYMDGWADKYYSPEKEVKPTYTHPKLEEVWKNIPFKRAARAALVPRPLPIPEKYLQAAAAAKCCSDSETEDDGTCFSDD